jgi:hypothetical protein
MVSTYARIALSCRSAGAEHNRWAVPPLCPGAHLTVGSRADRQEAAAITSPTVRSRARLRGRLRAADEARRLTARSNPAHFPRRLVTGLTAGIVRAALHRRVWNAARPPNIGTSMHVFTFRSRTYPGITGFTTWRSGSNLPDEIGPWMFVRQGAIHPGDPVAGIYGGGDTVLAGIERDGFYLGRVVVHPGRVR